MSWLALTRHPGSSCTAVRSIHASASCASPDAITFAYRVEAELARLVLPVTTGPRRVDGLWRHTCLEAFVKADGEGYCELNFSVSGQWAAYSFVRYRESMTALSGLPEPRITVRRDAEVFELVAQVARSGLAGCTAADRVKIALSAVVEDIDGGLSYWALAHPAGGPDFHHPEAFRLEVSVGRGER